MMRVLRYIRLNNTLVSSRLVDFLLPHVQQYSIETTCGHELIIQQEEDCYKLSQDSWSTITVMTGLCNSLTNPLTISNNACLKYLHIHGYALMNLESLTIENNPSLEFIQTGKDALFNTQYFNLHSKEYYHSINESIFLL